MSRTWDLIRKAESRAADPDLADVQVERVQVPPASHIEVFSDPRGPCADRFRLLRLRLQERWHPEKLKTVLITSPLPHDGKSTVALNLATALAEQGRRPVLLVEADLHRGTLREQVGLSFRPGLAECLEEGLKPLSAVCRLEPLGWYFLPAGVARTNPTELMQHSSIAKTLQQISHHFDWVIIDSPPVAPLADALSLRRLCDATLLVVRAGYTPARDIERSLELIGQKHVLGVVVNAIDGLQRAYRNYYGSYGSERAVKEDAPQGI